MVWHTTLVPCHPAGGQLLAFGRDSATAAAGGHDHQLRADDRGHGEPLAEERALSAELRPTAVPPQRPQESNTGRPGAVRSHEQTLSNLGFWLNFRMLLVIFK
ncbi:hypothetical protein [Kitasatospora phosalacinea]|uniref:hypothetical protein n=1 Tax=Kitasatospora phosalacinea TaxID=2065 RepID=UPI0012FE93D1|nr:hypothetical protein [Kitasatospora phosalacinea]